MLHAEKSLRAAYLAAAHETLRKSFQDQRKLVEQALSWPEILSKWEYGLYLKRVLSLQCP
jgi:hypothetical protein